MINYEFGHHILFSSYFFFLFFASFSYRKIFVIFFNHVRGDHVKRSLVSFICFSLQFHLHLQGFSLEFLSMCLKFKATYSLSSSCGKHATNLLSFQWFFKVYFEFQSTNLSNCLVFFSFTYF